MKKFITALMVAALVAAPIGCGGGPGSQGSPGGDGTPVDSASKGPGGETKASPSDADPKTGKVHSDADILKEMGEGGAADPAAVAGGGN